MNEGSQEIEFNNNLNLIAKSSLIVFIGVLFSKLFSYAYGIVIARVFGPEGYGLLTISLMVIGWFITFAGMGLNGGLVRFIPIFKAQKREDKIKSAFRTSFSKLIISSTIAFLILFLSSNFIAIKIFKNPQLTIFLKSFSLLVPLTIFLECFLSVIQANGKIFVYNFVYKFFIGLSKILFLILFIPLGLSSIYLSNILGTFLTLVLTIILFVKFYPNLLHKSKQKFKDKIELFKEILRYSWPLAFYGVIWNIFYWTDTLLIGYFRSTAEVGIYNVAEQIAFLLNLSPQLFLQLFFPLITKAYFQGKKEIVKELSKQVGKWIFAINIFMFTIIFLFSGEIIRLLFGQSFSSAKNPLMILSLGAIFYTVFKVSDNLMAMQGKSKVILKDIVLVFFFNLIGNFILIPRYGITGASISTSISLILLSLMLAFQANKYVSIIPLRRKMVNLFFAILISSALWVPVYFKFNTNLIFFAIFLIFFFAIYIAISFLFKAFDKNDLSVFRKFFEKIWNLRRRKKNIIKISR